MPGILPPKDCGILGSRYGKRGGRPRGTHKPSEQPYGMNLTDYNEIVVFLNSPTSDPIYPGRMKGGTSRWELERESATPDEK